LNSTEEIQLCGVSSPAIYDVSALTLGERKEEECESRRGLGYLRLLTRLRSFTEDALGAMLRAKKSREG